MASLIKLSTFIAVGNGFVFDGGQDVFGIDVFITPSFKKWEVFFSVENIRALFSVGSSTNSLP